MRPREFDDRSSERGGGWPAACSSTPESGPQGRGEKTKVRGTVLIIVLVTLLFATFALIAFMDHATTDLLVDHRVALANRLRMEAYSSLEVTLGVLSDFMQADNGLHSPSEGWSDPLGFAGYTPTDDRRVEITFEDESGKLSLPHVDAPTLSRLFQAWGSTQIDADTLADAMMGWMQREHVYSTPITPDYEQSAIPYEAPARPMRSYQELAAIDKVRESFYDKNGQPNEYWQRFVANVSLYNFARTNINGATADTLAALGQYNGTQQKAIGDYLAGQGDYQSQGPQSFTDVNQAQTIAGEGGSTAGFSTTISALRINVAVYEGKSVFRLSAVVAPPNGATTVTQTATHTTQSSTSSTPTTGQNQNQPNAAQANGATATKQNPNAQNLRYPFTLLEIRENDQIPPAPPPPAAVSP